MNQPNRQFSVIDEEVTQATAPTNDAATAMLALALRALSQRALVAVASLFTLLTCATVFWLSLEVIPHPDPLQLGVLVFYALFVTAINIIVRRH